MRGQDEGEVPFGDALSVVALGRRVQLAVLDIRGRVLGVFHCVVHGEMERRGEDRVVKS